MKNRLIFVFLVGYFLSYALYTYLIKGSGLGSWQLLIGSTMGCVGTMIAVWSGMGWWKHFQFRRPHLVPEVPVPTGPYRSYYSAPPDRFIPIYSDGGYSIWTRRPRRPRQPPINPAIWSGLATIGIILSSTIGYALQGASLVFMAILMKLGTIALAPIIDIITRRRIRPAAKTALALALMAAVVTFVGKSPTITIAALVINMVYLGAYAIKLRLMADRKGDITFLVTDQTIAAFGALGLVLLASLISAPIHSGFALLNRWDVWAIGLASQGTGLFGCLMFLSPQEHSFCVPLNRGGSVLATVFSSFVGGHRPAPMELVGAGLVLGAIAILAGKSGPVGTSKDHVPLIPEGHGALSHHANLFPIMGGPVTSHG